MKKIFTAFLSLAIFTGAWAQSVSVKQNGKEVLNVAPDNVEIQFSQSAPAADVTALPVDGTWCSVGTSITWYNDHITATQNAVGLTRGYQDRVMDRLAFTKLINVGDNGGCAWRSVDKIVKADYYTIEHGINDWGNSIAPGTIEDYLNNANNGTFAASYRKLIDKIFSVNPEAKIVLCTPRKGYGFSGYLPAKWYEPKNGNYLQDYAEIVRQIAQHESFPVADFFFECGGQRNLRKLSIDDALHPNDPGFQMMANVLIQALEKVITD